MAFEAIYKGKCADCGEDIHVGDLITRIPEGGGYVHHACSTDEAPSPLDINATEVVCTECFIIQPCGCKDGV